MTAVAGVLLALMRIVSGSVIAPWGLHWATNGLGYGFSGHPSRSRETSLPAVWDERWKCARRRGGE